MFQRKNTKTTKKGEETMEARIKDITCSRGLFEAELGVPGGAEQIMSQLKNKKTTKKGEETTVTKIKDITCSPKTKMIRHGQSLFLDQTKVSKAVGFCYDDTCGSDQL
ncbi:hypothetical protein ZEAMMB73_Zm00001d031301 [Zea mays]|uniref:Uncharacterized protein n=1 Tax=Zea mays TaxID=4577 RepID=A0A1D6KI35_MAIZE|nr:hypothetical protein ZEAMMB73_Zm00001d031301 [Zea mays]